MFFLHFTPFLIPHGLLFHSTTTFICKNVVYLQCIQMREEKKTKTTNEESLYIPNYNM